MTYFWFCCAVCALRKSLCFGGVGFVSDKEKPARLLVRFKPQTNLVLKVDLGWGRWLLS